MLKVKCDHAGGMECKGCCCEHFYPHEPIHVCDSVRWACCEVTWGPEDHVRYGSCRCEPVGGKNAVVKDSFATDPAVEAIHAWIRQPMPYGGAGKFQVVFSTHPENDPHVKVLVRDQHGVLFGLKMVYTG